MNRWRTILFIWSGALIPPIFACALPIWTVWTVGVGEYVGRRGFIWEKAGRCFSGIGAGDVAGLMALAIVGGAIVLIGAGLDLQRERRQRCLRGLCPVCGYDLHATPDCCPECGAAPGTTEGG